jgi:NTP pyrophosphatase (non-canonical NTP hydrolase)
MTIQQYQEEVDQWIHRIGVRYFNELTNMAILTEEVGEVSRLMARMYGEQSFKTPMSPDLQKESLADELADVIWVVTCLANQTGINLEDALRKNIEKKTGRDSERHRNNQKLHE